MFTEPMEINGMKVEDEDDEDEVVYEEEKMEADHQINLKEAESKTGMENPSGSSHQAGASQHPDEEQAGLEHFYSNSKTINTLIM